MTDDDDNAVVCSEERADGLLERITGDHRSLLQLQLYDVSDRDSGQSAFHLSLQQFIRNIRRFQRSTLTLLVGWQKVIWPVEKHYI